jgi:DNA invertase Pin-like site-specific DNA recombinase
VGALVRWVNFERPPYLHLILHGQPNVQEVKSTNCIMTSAADDIVRRLPSDWVNLFQSSPSYPHPPLLTAVTGPSTHLRGDCFKRSAGGAGGWRKILVRPCDAPRNRLDFDVSARPGGAHVGCQSSTAEFLSTTEGSLRISHRRTHYLSMKTTRKQSARAIGYVRVSTFHQELSPEVQRQRIESYCVLAGLELVDVIVERGVSGKVKLSKRPAGNKIAALLSAGVSHVVALKLDRLFRNAADALTTAEEWQNAGIEMHIVDMNGVSLSTGSAMGKMFLTMMAAFAEFERNVIADRTSAALQFKKAQGHVYSGITPFGFRAEAGVLVLEPSEQATLTRLRALRAGGMSFNRCADELNAEGVPSKLGGQWHPFTIQKVLAAV